MDDNTSIVLKRLDGLESVIVGEQAEGLVQLDSLLNDIESNMLESIDEQTVILSSVLDKNTKLIGTNIDQLGKQTEDSILESGKSIEANIVQLSSEVADYAESSNSMIIELWNLVETWLNENLKMDEDSLLQAAKLQLKIQKQLQKDENETAGVKPWAF
jgi:hypothetical protein